MLKDKQNIIDQVIEMSFWILDDKPEVVKELEKGEIGNMRCILILEMGEHKKTTNAWLVGKDESNKKIFSPFIVGSREKLIPLLIHSNNKEMQERVRKLWGINNTEEWKKNAEGFSENYKDYQIWLLEKEKVAKYFSDSNIGLKTSPLFLHLI